MLCPNWGFRQNFHCIDGSSDGIACRSSTPSKGGACSAFLRASCRNDSLVQTSAVQYKIGYDFASDHSNISLTSFEMDLAVFLASRGTALSTSFWDQFHAYLSSVPPFAVGHTLFGAQAYCRLSGACNAMVLHGWFTSSGDYSWLGYGWLGCGCGWEYGGKMPCDIYHRPTALDVDYGTPTELCHETADNSGVFVRQWTKSTITVNCNAGTSKIAMKP